MIDIVKSRKKKRYCAFIDFKQAFDMVWRQGLWNKMIKNDINGKFLNVLKSMYQNIK